MGPTSGSSWVPLLVMSDPLPVQCPSGTHFLFSVHLGSNSCPSRIQFLYIWDSLPVCMRPTSCPSLDPLSVHKRPTSCPSWTHFLTLMYPLPAHPEIPFLCILHVLPVPLGPTSCSPVIYFLFIWDPLPFPQGSISCPLVSPTTVISGTMYSHRLREPWEMQS